MYLPVVPLLTGEESVAATSGVLKAATQQYDQEMIDEKGVGGHASAASVH